MGIALLVLGALVSLGGWGILGTGFGLEQHAASGGGLSYLPSTSTAVDGIRVSLVEQLILFGYFLMTLGAIALATSRLGRLIRDQQELDHLPMEHMVEPAALTPVKPVHVDPKPAASVAVASQAAASRNVNATPAPEEPPHDDFDDAAGFAQIIQEGEIEGRHFIEYDNNIVDVQTSAGWRRFDSLEQAVEQLRHER